MRDCRTGCKNAIHEVTNHPGAVPVPAAHLIFQENHIMTTTTQQKHTKVWRSAAACLLVGAAAMVAATANAGECPADKRVADGQGQKPGPSTPKDVTDVVRATTDLAKEPLALNNRQFRLRQLEMKPGGIVPWHSHNQRPAMIYVVSGEVVEYASSCAVPIVHKTGDVAPEKNGTSHWWQNTGTTNAVLISVDLFPVEMKKDEHMM
jgi:quercetin dioxygenase-like cupin family protein